MSVLRVMNRNGDSALAEWTETDDAAKANAKAEFDRIIREGYFCYAPEGAVGSGQHTQLKQFDPSVEEIIARRPLAGG